MSANLRSLINAYKADDRDIRMKGSRIVTSREADRDSDRHYSDRNENSYRDRSRSREDNGW